MLSLGMGLGVHRGRTGARTLGARDSFNRADSATALGVAETGQMWTPLKGVWGIRANAAYFVSDPVLNNNVAVVETGLSDCAVWVTVTAESGGNCRLAFRVADVNNLFVLQYESSGGQWSLFQRVAGTYTRIAAYVTPFVANTEIGAVLLGTSIRIFIAGVERMTLTNTNHASAARHGISAFTTSTANLDNFRVEAL